MEITTQHAGELVDVSVRGRLDAYWSSSLANSLEELVRNGHHRIRLNLAEITYMSSAGIRVLLKLYKQLQRINGALIVSNPSETVKHVLELAGLQILLQSQSGLDESATSLRGRQLERAGVVFDVYDQQPGAVLACRVLGEPQRLAETGFEAAHCRTLRLDVDSFGLGLGAFGDSFDDCRTRFGEFLAAGGAATYLPTDTSSVPDYVVAAGALVPELQVLYALVCRGAFAQLARFEHPHGGRAVRLNELAEAALSLVTSEAAGMVMIMESAGLVGASLRRSPALATGAGAFFTHPSVRERLSYSPERSYPRSLALVVGVATRAQHTSLQHFVRPISDETEIHGHFHAAAFSYHPLQKGKLDLPPVVAGLFEAETLQGVMHLIGDDREVAGAGESEFLRGGLWVGPIGEVAAE